MQLVAEVDIPQSPELQEFYLDAKELKKLRDSRVLNLEAYIYLAIKVEYGNKHKLSIRLNFESFCEDWGLLPHELVSALAKLEKKNLLGCVQPEYLQMELFPIEDEPG